MQRTPTVESAFADEVRKALVGRGDGDVQVLDAEVRQAEDADGISFWRLTLALPVPAAGTWDVERSALLKRQARDVLEKAAHDRDLQLDGFTYVVLTAKDAPLQDIAVEEQPEEGERSDAQDA